MRAFKTLRHPGLVQFHDCLVDQTDQAWVVMDLADGGSLKDRLQACRKGGIPVAELLPYLKQVAAALDYLHDNDLLHRDVKPANILLADGQAKLTDFGLARLSANDVTRTMGGTPLYKSPEMFGGKVVKRASDQYCLAMTYAELRRGEHPFAAFLEGAGKKLGLEHAHRNERPNLSGLPSAEQKAIETALAKEYQDRFRTCTEFVEAVEAALVQKTSTTSRQAATQRKTATLVQQTAVGLEPEPEEEFNLLQEEPKSNWVGWIAATVLIAALVGGGLYVWNNRTGGGGAIVNPPVKPDDKPPDTPIALDFPAFKVKIEGQANKSRFLEALQEIRDQGPKLERAEREQLGDMVVAKLVNGINRYDALKDYRVDQIYDSNFISEDQRRAIGDKAKIAAAEHAKAQLDELQKTYSKDRQIMPALRAVEDVRTTCNTFGNLPSEIDDRVRFWKELQDLDEQLQEPASKPADAFRAYVTLVRRSKEPIEHPLDRQTAELLGLAKKGSPVEKEFLKYADLFKQKAGTILGDAKVESQLLAFLNPSRPPS